MSTEIEHATDWDAQRDLLSALLDDRLEPDEAAALRRHLQTCSRCAEELAALRQVVGMLHALPAAALPRSFALSVPAAAPAADLPQVDRQARRLSPWPRVAQWAGGLVAAAGLLIGVAGALGHLPSAAPLATGSSAAGVYAPQPTSPQHNAGVPASATARAADRQATVTTSTWGSLVPGAPSAATAAPAPTPAVLGAPAVHPAAQQPVPELPVIGGTMVLAGGAAFAVGTRTRRKHR